MEIGTYEDGTITLESVAAHFPGTTTLKYRSPSGTGLVLLLSPSLSCMFKSSWSEDLYPCIDIWHLTPAQVPWGDNEGWLTVPSSWRWVGCEPSLYCGQPRCRWGAGFDKRHTKICILLRVLDFYIWISTHCTQIYHQSLRRKGQSPQKMQRIG